VGSHTVEPQVRVIDETGEDEVVKRVDDFPSSNANNGGGASSDQYGMSFNNLVNSSSGGGQERDAVRYNFKHMSCRGNLKGSSRERSTIRTMMKIGEGALRRCLKIEKR
jgi:hypothetical protein